MKKNLQLLALVFLLLSLASCGGESGHGGKSPRIKNRNTEENKLCLGLDCLSAVNWKILLPGKSFPENSKVMINGLTVLDECLSKQKYAIDRGVDPQMLYLDNYLIPEKGNLKLEIVDQGVDCGSSTEFLKNEAVDFVFNKTHDMNEIVIEL